MKKTLLAMLIALVATIGICASPLPFDLEMDFDIDHLLDNNFDLELDDDGIILICPPDNEYLGRDSIIERFAMVDTGDIGGWIVTMAEFTDDADYADAYAYIADELGEGTNDKNTRFQIQRYSREPSEEQLMGLLLSGDFGSYMSKAIPALMISELFNATETEIDHINMWNTEDLAVYTIGAEDEEVVIYVNSGLFTELMESAMGLALLGALAEV